MWELLGVATVPPRVASTSLFLRPSPSFQAKVCCWFLSPLVPTHPGTCLLAWWVRLGGTQWQEASGPWEHGTGTCTILSF